MFTTFLVDLKYQYLISGVSLFDTNGALKRKSTRTERAKKCAAPFWPTHDSNWKENRNSIHHTMPLIDSHAAFRRELIMFIHSQQLSGVSVTLEATRLGSICWTSRRIRAHKSFRITPGTMISSVTQRAGQLLDAITFHVRKIFMSC